MKQILKKKRKLVDGDENTEDDDLHSSDDEIVASRANTPALGSTTNKT